MNDGGFNILEHRKKEIRWRVLQILILFTSLLLGIAAAIFT